MVMNGSYTTIKRLEYRIDTKSPFCHSAFEIKSHKPFHHEGGDKHAFTAARKVCRTDLQTSHAPQRPRCLPKPRFISLAATPGRRVIGHPIH